MSWVTLAANYDGTPLVSDVSNEPRLLIRLVRGLDEAPEVRGVDTIIPGSAGRIARARVWDRRVIELGGLIMGTGTTDAEQLEDTRAALEELRVLFDPTRQPATLIITLEDGGTATITARPVNMVVGPDEVPQRREVSIELEAVDEDWVVTGPVS